MSTLIDQHDALAIIPQLDLVLGAPKSAELSLDENRAPYAMGTLVFPMPDADTRAAIDLRADEADDLRIDLRLRRDFGPPWSVADLTALVGGSVAAMTSRFAGSVSNVTRRMYRGWNRGDVRAAQIRNCDLYLTGRTFDDETKEMSLTVASSEARMQGDGLVATSPLDPGTTSLLSIAAMVLARYGDTLDPASTDATVAEVAATVWQPGVAADDYLNSMLEAASLRLWCDETGRWLLSPRQETTEGAATFAPTASSDAMTWDPTIAPDAVVIKYTWTDTTGAQHVEWDADGAAVPHALQPVERDAIYPGPGAASGMLARAVGRGRVVSITEVNDLDLTPGQPAVIRLPDTVELAGNVSSVQWVYPDAKGAVTTRGLTDVPPDSFLAGADTTYTSLDVQAHHPALAIRDFTDWSDLA